MARFLVLEPPDGSQDRVIFIREGFSWAALFFTAFWALFHRMWIAAALLILAFTALALADDYGLTGFWFSTVSKLGLALLFGFEARRLQVVARERTGYRRVGLLEASSLEAAELTYFAEHRKAVPEQAAPLRPSAVGADTLGLFGKDF